MKLSKRIKTLLIIGLVITGLYQGGKYGLNHFIYKKLPELIAEKNQTPYDFSYEDIEYSPALRRLIISGITITPKDTITHKNTTYIKGHLDNIVIQGVALKELFKTKNLKANKIKLNSPDIVVIQGDTIIEQPKEVDITNIIDINSIIVNDGHILVKKRDDHTRLNEVYNFNADITGVHFAQEVKEKGLPFSYEGYTITCDSVYNKLNDWHKLTLGKTLINPTLLEINQVSVKPFQKTKNTADLEKNLLIIDIPKVTLSGTDWGYKDEKHFYLQIGKIETDSTTIHIQNNKLKEDIVAAEQQPQKGKKKNKNRGNTPVVKVVDTIPTLIPFDLQIGDININKLSLDALDTWNTDKMNISIHKINNKIGEPMEINKVLIDSPIITFTPNQVKKKVSNRSKLLMDHIKLDSLIVNKGSFAIHQRKGDKQTLNISNVNATILNIGINQETSLKKIPFSYGQSKFTTGAIKYDTQKYYDITADNLYIDNKNLKLVHFVMKPKYSRKKTVSMFRYADDIFTLNAKEIALKDYSWDFDKAGTLLFKTEHLDINQLDANIFRDKAPTFNMSIKPMFSKKLRDIPFGLQLNTVAIKNSKLVYEETDKNAVAPGKIMFHNFNATIKNVYSGYGQTKVPTTSIAVNARFMNAAPLRVDWTFNVLNKRDQFNIQGKITNFPANSMQPFLQPYIKASTQGSISLVTFNFSGNNKSATGTYGMKYEDLRVTIYKKDGEKKKKFLSAMGNLIIRKSTKDEVKTVNIKTVDRVQEKSFFNYLWLCIMQGLKQTVL